MESSQGRVLQDTTARATAHINHSSKVPVATCCGSIITDELNIDIYQVYQCSEDSVVRLLLFISCALRVRLHEIKYNRSHACTQTNKQTEEMITCHSDYVILQITVKRDSPF